MELDYSNVTKQPHLSDATIKNVSQRKVLTIQGKGDPMKTFDDKLAKVYEYIEKNDVEIPNKPSFGIYYKNRDKASVGNVIWDACVEVSGTIQNANDYCTYKEIPEQLVISTILTGGYNLIGDAVHYLENIAKSNNLEIKWELTEVYIKEGENPVTELWFPIAES